MAGAIRPLGGALATMPVGASQPGRTAGFAFDMFYPMGNFVPWRDSAWALLRERMRILAERCEWIETSGDAPAVIAQARQRVDAVAATLAPAVATAS